MKKYVTKIIDKNCFFLSIILFVVFLPLSQAMVSICAGIMLFVAFIEDNWHNKFKRLKINCALFTFPAIYIIYLVSSIISNKFSASLYDLQKSLFFLVLPLAFILGKRISSQQKKYVFYVFIFSVFVSTIITFLNWKLYDNPETFSIHKASLISHIRFSFQLILSFWFVFMLLLKNVRKLINWQRLLLLAGATYFLAFLIFQQSLTGLIALTGSIVFFVLLLLFLVSKRIRAFLFILTIVLVTVPVVYVTHVARKFYDIESVDKSSIEKKTARGNLYNHDFNNPMVENGRYVFLYLCQDEVREEWDKVSEIKYDSMGLNGYPVSSTLIRYLTSKGLRKDAEGVRSLSKQDVLNVNNGIANEIYAGAKLSLYPRIYQTIWEYYIYSKTGNANQKSFSQRIEYAKAAICIIKQHLWFGVGTGNWKEEFRKTYAKNNPKLKEEFYGSSHNQYLNYMVKFGIIGFFAILFFILYPVFKTGRYSDHLFLVFLVFLFFANFADSNFESHMGSSFFVFFYCIFICGGTNYLQIPCRKQP